MGEIVIVGIAVVDAVARPVESWPAPGGLRFFDQLTFTTGGNAVNCAIALARLGVRAEVVARVGADVLGGFVVGELERNGVSAAHVVRDGARATSFSFVGVGAHGERSFLHTTGANAALARGDVPAALLAGKGHVFVTGTMLMDALDGEPTAGLLRDARGGGCTTILDTVHVEGLDAREWRRRVLPALEHLDYFIPSEAEARALSGEADPGAAADSFRRQGARRVVIKLGARGVLCVDETGRAERVPAGRVREVVDCTGAGDCWAAGFLMGLVGGRSFVEAACLGNAVAGVSVQAAGATTGITGPEPVRALLEAMKRSAT